MQDFQNCDLSRSGQCPSIKKLHSEWWCVFHYRMLHYSLTSLMSNCNVTFYYLEKKSVFLGGYCFISYFILLSPYFLPLIYPSIYHYSFLPERQESSKGGGSAQRNFSSQLHDGKHHSELKFYVSLEY